MVSRNLGEPEGLITKGQYESRFWGERNVLQCACGGNYMVLCIFTKPSRLYIPQRISFTVVQIDLKTQGIPSIHLNFYRG